MEEALAIAKKYTFGLVENNKTVWRLIEMIALFVGIPLTIHFQWLPIPPLVLLLLLFAFVAWRFFSGHSFWKRFIGPRCPAKTWLRIFLRFAMSVAIVSTLVWLVSPERFLSAPVQKPFLWMLTLLLYPLLSVMPQEIIFRGYFWERYAMLFPKGTASLLLVNALFFSFAHIMFLNWVALLLTFVSSFLFADTYLKTKSIFVVSVEHTLYGLLIFTIGLGEYFTTFT